MGTYVRSELTFGTLSDRRSGRKLARAACAACGAEGHLLTVEYAAQLSGLSLRQLFEQVEGGHLHYTERPGGPFVCLASLCAVTPQKRLVDDSAASFDALVPAINERSSYEKQIN